MKKKLTNNQKIVSLDNTPFTSRFYKNGNIHVQLCHPHAQLPERAHVSDIGFDLTLISRVDGKTEDTVHDVTVFDTGIKIQPPPGHYVEILPRSSLYKEGYMLVNSVGVIDPEYEGDLMVALSNSVMEMI